MACTSFTAGSATVVTAPVTSISDPIVFSEGTEIQNWRLTIKTGDGSGDQPVINVTDNGQAAYPTSTVARPINGTAYVVVQVARNGATHEICAV